MKKRPIILTIIDGLGLRKETQGNAFALANTPTFDEYFASYPHSIIQASGEFVGLPQGQMGNSEVGHLNIGAGQVVYTGLSLIKKALQDGSYQKNKLFLDMFKHVKENNTTLHLMGLLSPGGVHSLEDHLFALIKAAGDYGVPKLSVHIFGDGRDVAPQSILSSIAKLEQVLQPFPNYHIASIAGRFYSMDRDKMFDRVEKGYEAICGRAENTFEDATTYVEEQYSKGKTDEFFEPAINTTPGVKFVKDNDSVFFYNFRPDRARQLTHLLIHTDLYDATPSHPVKLAQFGSMMKYEGIDAPVAFAEMEITEPIGKVIEQAGLTQLRLAETQKYAHVTFFMDGGIDVVYKNSDRKMIDSLKVESYADAPQMSAQGITDYLLDHASQYDFVIMNFANPDMVGHTGNLKSATEAVTILDQQLGRIKQWVEVNNAVQFITADHGNAEVTEDENGQPATKHTSQPVMLICTDKDIQLKDGQLSDIAPTILDYAGIQPSKEMTGKSLIIKK